MRKWYSLLLTLALPVIVAVLSYKMRRSPHGWTRLKNWLGYSQQTPTKQGVWIHAASVGEVRAAIPLVQALRLAYPAIAITITTQSATGLATVNSLLGPLVVSQYCPLDVPFAMKRFLTRIKPALVIILETEIWPNLLYQLNSRKIPVILANARLSARSVTAFRKWESLFKPAFATFSHVFAQTEGDALNFLRLGVPRHALTISGNLKYDCKAEPGAEQEGLALREKIGKRPVWIAASTHAFEEEPILQAFKILKQAIPDLLLILVPRHPERFEPIAKHLLTLDYRMHRFSEGFDHLAMDDIFLCDVMGKLSMLYHASDVAFIGGSLSQGQGHNPLEAAVAECAIITGMHVSSFSEICENLAKEQALFFAEDPTHLASKTLTLLQMPTARSDMTQAALKCADQHKGALEKHMEFIATHCF